MMEEFWFAMLYFALLQAFKSEAEVASKMTAIKPLLQEENLQLCLFWNNLW